MAEEMKQGNEAAAVSAELRDAAVACKRRISSQFMLVDPASARERVRGERFWVTRKIDGVMACAFYHDGAATLVGTGGKNLSAAPCGAVLASSLAKAGVKSATIVCELYLPAATGRPRVGDVSAALADASLIGKLRLAPFDIVDIDGGQFRAANYGEVHARLSELFADEAVRPVEMREAGSYDEVGEIYREWVEGEGAEGLVIHSASPVVWKLKPRHTIDAAIVGYTIGDQGVRDMLFAVRDGSGDYRVLGPVGNGMSAEFRESFQGRLKELDCESKYIEADSRGIAFKMVRPEIVAELTVGEFVAEDFFGKPKYNAIVSYDGATGWTPKGRSAGVSALRVVLERIRDDKTVDPECVRESQITDICPFAAPKARSAGELPKSELLARKVFKKSSGDKLMVQKFIVWKTNKEADPRYPAYVYHYTDYSSGRKDPLKRDIRVSSSKDQLLALMEADIAENVKKGWVEA